MSDAVPGFDGRLVRNVAAALLFMQSVISSLDVYSSLMSSPWSTTKFAKEDDEAANLARYYIAHSVFVSLASNGFAAYLAESWWPIVGSIVANAYMLYLYWHGLRDKLFAFGSGTDATSTTT